MIFYDWDSGKVIHRIDVNGVKEVYWSESGTELVLACGSNYFVLSVDLDKISQDLANGTADPEEGVDDCFELVDEMGEVVTSGEWGGGLFLVHQRHGQTQLLCGRGSAHFVPFRSNRVFVGLFGQGEPRVLDGQEPQRDLLCLA